MWTSLRIASLGAMAQQHVLDISSNNLANVNTPAFKRQRADLADVIPVDTIFGTGTEPGPLTLGQVENGGGAVLAGLVSLLHNGPLLHTGEALDVSITGVGFLSAQTSSGAQIFTRNGALRLDAERRITTAEGDLLMPPVTVPFNVDAVHIGRDGAVRVTRGSEIETVGQIELSRFTNPEGLLRLGHSRFAQTPEAGNRVVGNPGDNGLGTLSAGTLEGSNVDIGEELVRVIQAQRAYQLNLRSFQAAGDMLQIASAIARP